MPKNKMLEIKGPYSLFRVFDVDEPDAVLLYLEDRQGRISIEISGNDVKKLRDFLNSYAKK